MTEHGRYHPLRWRQFTWFIVHVEAFGAGFFVGLLIGYRLLSPLGSNAQEGVAMLLFFAVALAVLVTVVLAVACLITGLVTWQRRSGGEPVHRWIWLPAPIALVIGGLLGTQLIWGWYANERISDSPSLRVWSQLPADTTVFGGDGNQIMNDVILDGPAQVAVGSDGLAGGEDAAVWTSSDRRSWSRVPDQAVFGGEGAQVMSSVSAGPGGLVAVGYEAIEGDADAAVWTSLDGTTWSRVPHDERIFGGKGNQIMNDVTRAGSGLVAVGSSGPEGMEHAAVWISPDGVSWSRVPDDAAVFGGSGPTFMASVDAGASWIVAVGYTHAWTRGDPAPVWISRDGLTWSRVPDHEGVFGGAWLSGVAVGGSGIVSVGRVDTDAAVWTSPADRMRWSRVPHDEFVFGGYASSIMNSVIFSGSTMVVVGATSWPTSPVGEAWLSADGTTWSRVAHTGPMTPGMMNGVTGVGGRLVAVGLVVGDEAGPDASVWVTVREVA